MNFHRTALLFFTITALVCSVGCETELDALRKYHAVLLISTVPKAVSDDVQSYIRSLKVPASDITHVTYMEDEVGGHAVVIAQELPKSQGMDSKAHVLIYNRNTVRTKAKVYFYHLSC